MFGCGVGDSEFGGGDGEATFVPVITPVATRISKTVRIAATMANTVTVLAPPLEPSTAVTGLSAMAISSK